MGINKIRTSNWDAVDVSASIDPTAVDRTPNQPRKLFDITCIIGSVYESPDAQFTPNQVAFTMIADHVPALGAEVVFTFPDEDGSIINVAIHKSPAPNR